MFSIVHIWLKNDITRKSTRLRKKKEFSDIVGTAIKITQTGS